MISPNTSRVRLESLRVTSADYPGFQARSDYVPQVGERVQTTEGEAEVIRVLGRVTGGGRLLELHLDERPKPPFFASSLNVLIRDD